MRGQSQGMALYSVQADWRARVGRHTSGAHGTGGVRRGVRLAGNRVGLAGNGVGLERGTGSD